MGEPSKALYVLLTAVFTAQFNNFFAIKRFYQLTIYRLSEKNVYFCTWLRLILFVDCKGNQKG